MATIKKRAWTTGKGERKEAWQLRYVDSQGVERSKQFDRKGDASAYLTRIGWELSQGTHTADSASVTVAEAADIWIATATAKGRERSTIKQYKEWAELHIKPLIGDKKLSQLSMPMVETFKDSLLETRSPAMAGKAVRGLSSILTEAQRRGLVAQNVAKGVKVVRAGRDRKRIAIPAKTELRAMLDTAQEHFADYRPLLLMVIFTGLRSSEIRALRGQDIDLKAAQISVAQRADQWGEIGPPKSAAGYRTVPIPPMLVKELRAWLLRTPPSPLGLVFPNSQGGVRLHSNMLNREYWPLQVKAGLVRKSGKEMRAKYDFHSLRHAAASAWIKQRVDLKRLTTWLGHASVQITLDTYGHLIKDDLGDAAIANAAARELLS